MKGVLYYYIQIKDNLFKQNEREVLGCLRRVEFCRLYDMVRCAFYFFAHYWFIKHWHPFIAGYP